MSTCKVSSDGFVSELGRERQGVLEVKTVYTILDVAWCDFD